MCGFVGLINTGTLNDLKNAVKSISHRGPDDEGLKWFDELSSGIGHRRLSIIDLSETGHQPMVHKECGNWIVFNGEIYNYADIRNELAKNGYTFFSHSDTEVVLKAFHHWGEGFLDKLNGMFSFIILNEKSGDLFGARDRLGIKPFYYQHIENRLFVSSEIKGILACKSSMKEPDFFALHTPIHFQIGPYTGFKNILKLPPGHFIEFKNRQLKIQSYWKIHVTENDIDELQAINQADKLLEQAVKFQLVSDVPVGLLLSGGLDSSLLSAYMRKLNSGRIDSFTISFYSKDLKRHGNVNDAYYARKVAERFNLNHHETVLEPDIMTLLPKMIWHLDEPIADPSVINTYLISKAANEIGVKVLLTGMGADEVMGGYRSYLACLKGDAYAAFPTWIRKIIDATFGIIPQSIGKKSFRKVRYVKKFMHFAGLPRFERYLGALNTALTSKDFNEYYLDDNVFEYSWFYKLQKKLYDDNTLSYLTKMCFNDTRTYLPDHNLTYSDKGSMAAGVELRPPLIDHMLVEFMFTLPPKYRINRNVQKYLIKKLAERYLPQGIINRPKAPFSVPLRSWLKDDLKEMVDDLLSYDTLKRRGIYNPVYVNKLIRKDRKGIEDNSQLIFRLMVNELWFRTFFN